jgi:D-alanine-D-alanine ligase
MKIGLTYDLRSDYLAAGYSEEDTAEFDRADTIDSISAAVEKLGHEADRIGNVRQLIARLAAGDRWDLVFNVAEGLAGTCREAQVPLILDIYEIPYTFSDPVIMTLALDKHLTKLVVRNGKFPTADSVVVRDPADVYGVDLPFPLFAKPLAEGTGKGVSAASRVADRSALWNVCGELIERYRQPALVESYLPGREFTVGVLGTGSEAEVIGTLEIILLAGAEPSAYSYVNKERCEELVEYRLVFAAQDAEVRRAEEIALGVYRLLECRDAGRIDLRSNSAGEPHFMEINPLAGMHPEHSDLPILAAKTGLGYQGLVERIVRSASRRV